MNPTTFLTLLLFTCFASLNAQHNIAADSTHTATKPRLVARFGVLGSAGLHQEFDEPAFLCFDCTPREYQTSPRPNALVAIGLTADVGKANRHLGLRGAMAIAYQQFKWDYDVTFWPRSMPKQHGTVHLRANNLLVDLNLRLRYATLGKRPIVLQVGAFANGFLTRQNKNYFTTPNRSAYFHANFLMPPAGLLANLAKQFPLKNWSLEPFIEARYSLRYVLMYPNASSGSIQIGLSAWMPSRNQHDPR
jgi:hypothetical protein